ncbi:MAG: hypothetical protein WAX04_02170 [Oscillospiraceae bacterium]
MFNARGLIRYTFLIPIIILILSCPLAFPTAASTASNRYEVPIYQVPISEKTQRDIWKICEENHLSYELVLAVLHTEGINNISIVSVKADIEILVYYRDYWASQGFPDEKVFDLLLLSRERGIEGCLTLIKENNAYELDNYVQKVTEYKYYLEQSNNTQPPVVKYQNLGPSSSSIIKN